jgi:hypothetical protein
VNGRTIARGCDIRRFACGLYPASRIMSDGLYLQ